MNELPRFIFNLFMSQRNQFSSVAQSCPSLCNPMNCSTPGLPVHHHLPGFTQTHVHWVRDAIRPSHPRSSPSPPAPNPSQHQGLFQWVNSSHLSRNVNWYGHYGEQYGGSLKTKNRTTVWPSIPTTGHILWENHNLKRHTYPNVHCSTIYDSQDMEAT